MSLNPCLVLMDTREWPAELAERRDSFDARLRYAFAHRKPLAELTTELDALARRHAPPELLDLACTCLRAVARVNAHDSLSFALLRAVRDAVFGAR